MGYWLSKVFSSLEQAEPSRLIKQEGLWLRYGTSRVLNCNQCHLKFRWWRQLISRLVSGLLLARLIASRQRNSQWALFPALNQPIVYASWIFFTYLLSKFSGLTVLLRKLKTILLCFSQDKYPSWLVVIRIIFIKILRIFIAFI